MGVACEISGLGYWEEAPDDRMAFITTNGESHVERAPRSVMELFGISEELSNAIDKLNTGEHQCRFDRYAAFLEGAFLMVPAQV